MIKFIKWFNVGVTIACILWFKVASKICYADSCTECIVIVIKTLCEQALTNEVDVLLKTIIILYTVWADS